MADYVSSNTGPEIDDAVATVKGAGNGIAVKTGTGAGVRRSIAGTLNQVDVANGDGIAGNPTVSLAVAVTTSLSKADTAVQPASLATVATTGAYADLSGKPTLGNSAALDVGTIAGTVAAGDDSRFTDARTPLSHKSTHAIGGTDALSPADIGAEVSGAAASAVATHVGQADPHAQYALETSLASVATSGSYPDLLNKPTLGTAAALNVGTTAGTVAAGDDARFSTNLTYTPALRVIGSSTGTGATLPLFSATEAGLVSGSGGGTANFLRADGTWAPAGGAPAGSINEIQYNADGSSLGASSNLTFDPTTKTLSLKDKMVINATSGFAGNLLDLQVAGSSKLKVEPTVMTFLGHEFRSDANALVFTNSGGVRSFISRSDFSLIPDTSFLGWGNLFSFASNLRLYKDDNNILAQRNLANAQTFRIYNTYTDASNYQRTSITDDNTGLVIDQQYAGTGAVRTNLLELKNNGSSVFTVDKDQVITGRYFLNKDLNSGDYFFGANFYAKLSIGLAANTPLGWTSSTVSPNVARDVGLARDQAGVLKITDGTTGTGYVKQIPVAVSALPAAATVGAGTRGFVSNSSVSASGNFGAIVSAAVLPATEYVVPVFSDGTNWLIG